MDPIFGDLVPKNVSHIAFEESGSISLSPCLSLSFKTYLWSGKIWRGKRKKYDTQHKLTVAAFDVFC